MSWVDRHKQVQKDMEDASKIDALISVVRSKIMKRYLRKAGKLGLGPYSFATLASSAAVVGLAKALKVLDRWDPDKREFAYFVFLKAKRIALGDLTTVERKQKKDALELTNFLELDEVDAETPHNDVNGFLHREELRSLLGVLKFEHSQVLNLHLYGYSNSEIALRLDRSEESTKSLLRRAKEAAARARARQNEMPGPGTRDGPPPPPSPPRPPATIISLEEHRTKQGAQP